MIMLNDWRYHKSESWADAKAAIAKSHGVLDFF